MQNFLLTAAIALLSRLDVDAFVAAVYSYVARRMPRALTERIEVLVRRVDDLDLPGEEKFRTVMAALLAKDSPVRELALAQARNLVLEAIQSAYDRMKAKG